MANDDPIPLNGLKASGSNGVEILDEKIAVASQQGIAPSGTSQLTVGGSAGGITAYLANTYLSSTSLRDLFVYLSPTIGIIIMGVYSFSAAQISKWWKAREAERTRVTLLRRAREGLKDAKDQLAAIKSDGASTQDHKTTARERVQLIERKVLDLNVQGIVVLD